LPDYPLRCLDLFYGYPLEVVVAEKLPDELSELLREDGVERGLTSISLLQVLPVALFVILVNVLVEEVCLLRL
jgi:hypothetical protein